MSLSVPHRDLSCSECKDDIDTTLVGVRTSENVDDKIVCEDHHVDAVVQLKSVGWYEHGQFVQGYKEDRRFNIDHDHNNHRRCDDGDEFDHDLEHTIGIEWTDEGNIAVEAPEPDPTMPFSEDTMAIYTGVAKPLGAVLKEIEGMVEESEELSS